MEGLSDLLELMYGASERFRSVRAITRTWSHRDRLREAFDRPRTTSRGGTRIVVSMGDDAEPPPVESESIERLLLERPGKVRLELEGGHVEVTDGKTGWSYRAGWGTTVSEVDSEGAGATPDRLIFDPAPFLGGVDLELVGRETVAGRVGIRVGATPRLGAVDWHDWGGLLPGADSYELVVDVESGVVLRAAAFLDGEPVAVTELLEVTFDEQFPAETFTFVPPEGERVVTSDELRDSPVPERVSIDEAAQRASFTLWIPAEVPPEWTADVKYMPARELWSAPEAVFIHYRSMEDGEGLSLAEAALVEGEDGFHVSVGSDRGATLRIEREGTAIMLASETLSQESLAELAASLVPAPTEPPRLGE